MQVMMTFAPLSSSTEKLLQSTSSWIGKPVAFVVILFLGISQAIENLNGAAICGRNVTVNEARPREKRGGGGGRR